MLPPIFTFMEKYEAQSYKEPVEGNFEDAIAAIVIKKPGCGGDNFFYC